MRSLDLQPAIDRIKDWIASAAAWMIAGLCYPLYNAYMEIGLRAIEYREQGYDDRAAWALAREDYNASRRRRTWWPL